MRGSWWSEGHRARGARERVGCIGSACTVSGTVCVYVCARVCMYVCVCECVCVCVCVCFKLYTGT